LIHVSTERAHLDDAGCARFSDRLVDNEEVFQL